MRASTSATASAAVESVHSVVDRVLGGQNEHGRVESPLAQRGENLDAIASGQHEIEDHEVEGLVVHEKKPFLAGGGNADVVVLRLELVAQSLRDLSFIFDDQDTHSTPEYNEASPLPHLTRMSGTRQWRPRGRGSSSAPGGATMKRITTLAVIAYAMFAAIPLGIHAQPNPAAGRESLARALVGAWLPLESGLVVSSTQGTPISAKYEIDNGTFQLSVYTVKADAFAGESFGEVVVDFNTGTVARVEAITDSGDLAAAQGQKAAMVIARRSLAEATAEAVNANAGYRAVSAIPGVDGGGRPVVEVTLVRGSDWKVVSGRLN